VTDEAPNPVEFPPIPAGAMFLPTGYTPGKRRLPPRARLILALVWSGFGLLGAGAVAAVVVAIINLTGGAS